MPMVRDVSPSLFVWVGILLPPPQVLRGGIMTTSNKQNYTSQGKIHAAIFLLHLYISDVTGQASLET